MNEISELAGQTSRHAQGITIHTAGQPYNVLTGADKNGLFPRTSEMLSILAEYTDVLHAYCVDTDPICAGGDVVDTHLNYFDVYTNQTAEWVQRQVKAAGDDDSTTTSTSKSQSKTTEKETAATGSEAETTEEASETKSKASSKATSTPVSTKEASTTTAFPSTAIEGSSSGSSASVTASAAEATTSGSAAPLSNLKLGAVFLAAGAALAL